MYASTDFVSVTDMRKDISGIMTLLKKDKQKIIFKNNKPTAVLIDFSFYEQMKKDNEIRIESLEGSEEFSSTQKYKKLISLMQGA